MKKYNLLTFALLLVVPGLLFAQNIYQKKITSAPMANFSASDSAICDSFLVVNFTDLSTNNPTSWQWYFPGAIPDTSTLKDPTNIAYSGYGCYSVKLVVENNIGSDSLTDSNYICLDAPPHITLTGVFSLCMGSGALFTASGGTSYYWSAGFTTSSIYLQPPANINYTVWVYNGACVNDSTFFVLVDTMPIVRFIGDTSVCIGDTSILHIYGGHSYLWQGGSTADSLLFIDTFSRTTDTLFTWTLSVSSGACVRDTVVRIRAIPCQEGINEVRAVNGELNIYPNPTAHSINVQMQLLQKQNVEFMLYNAMEQIVYDKNLSDQNGIVNQQIDLSLLSNGIYLLKVNRGNSYSTKKIIKQE